MNELQSQKRIESNSPLRRKDSSSPLRQASDKEIASPSRLASQLDSLIDQNRFLVGDIDFEYAGLCVVPTQQRGIPNLPIKNSMQQQ